METKTCNRCGEIYSLDQFHRNKYKRNGKPYVHIRGECRKCASKYVSLQVKKRKEKFVAYKGGKCVRCGYDKCIAALEFHHRDNLTKEFNIGDSTGYRSSLAELDKCDLLCANCHREVHEESVVKQI